MTLKCPSFGLGHSNRASPQAVKDTNSRYESQIQVSVISEAGEPWYSMLKNFPHSFPSFDGAFLFHWVSSTVKNYCRQEWKRMPVVTSLKCCSLQISTEKKRVFSRIWFSTKKRIAFYLLKASKKSHVTFSPMNECQWILRSQSIVVNKFISEGLARSNRQSTPFLSSSSSSPSQFTPNFLIGLPLFMSVLLLCQFSEFEKFRSCV